MDGSFWSLAVSVLSICLIDLALSGDNAAVIGLAIKEIPPWQARLAAAISAGGAITLRVILTAIATTLMNVPYLKLAGGIVLFAITWKLVAHEGGENAGGRKGAGFWEAVWIIIVADLSMAFDNVLGVAGAARGNVWLVLFGLALSIPILVLGSTWLARIMQERPLVIYVGAAVLVRTAANMMLSDDAVLATAGTNVFVVEVAPWLLAAATLIWGWFEAGRLRASRARKEAAAAGLAWLDKPGSEE